MTIVTPTYRPKRAPRKKWKQPALTQVIVTLAPLKPRKGPVIRVGSMDQSDDTTSPKLDPSHSAIVEPKRKPDRRSNVRAGPEFAG
jgi:hypothetical protein